MLHYGGKEHEEDKDLTEINVGSPNFFRPGRPGKVTRTYLGTLVYNKKYEMHQHKYDREKTEATYLCKYRQHPAFKCKGKLKIVNIKKEHIIYTHTSIHEDKWVISTPKDDIVHICNPDNNQIIENSFVTNGIKPERRYRNKERPEWFTKICHVCGQGFNFRSQFTVTKCKECETFVHTKNKCLRKINGELICKSCKPLHKAIKPQPKEDTIIYVGNKNPGTSASFFRSGRKLHGKQANLGILYYKMKYIMIHHKYNKERTEALYYCKYRNHPLLRCRAKLKIVNRKETEEDNWIILSPHKEIVHTCKPDEDEIVDKSIIRKYNKPKRKYQDHERPEWLTSICHVCSQGFNFNSEVTKCQECNNIIHVKRACLSTRKDCTSEVFCTKCKPPVKTITHAKKYMPKEESIEYIITLHYTMSETNYLCVHCDYLSSIRFNIQRHILRQHGQVVQNLNKDTYNPAHNSNEDTSNRAQNSIEAKFNTAHNSNEDTSNGEQNSIEDTFNRAHISNEDTSNTTPIVKPHTSLTDTANKNIPNTYAPESVESLLIRVKLEYLFPFFQKEDIDMEVLATMTSMELKSLGLKYGPAKKIITAIHEGKMQT